MRAAKGLVAPDFRCPDEAGFTVAMSDPDPTGLDGFGQLKQYAFSGGENDRCGLAFGSTNNGLIDLDDQRPTRQ